jgi:Circularly permutated YpsA SLOG family
MTLTKIVSGGQTAVDRGALDAALAAGFPCGGWCPADRRAEDGPIPQLSFCFQDEIFHLS